MRMRAAQGPDTDALLARRPHRGPSSPPLSQVHGRQQIALSSLSPRDARSRGICYPLGVGGFTCPRCRVPGAPELGKVFPMTEPHGSFHSGGIRTWPLHPPGRVSKTGNHRYTKSCGTSTQQQESRLHFTTCDT